MSHACPFCQPGVTSQVLWENEFYRIIPDKYPRCIGHLLVISKPHQHNHMSIPIERLPVFEIAQYQASRFLLDIFGKASFLENGGAHQEVSHAHLHCVPFTASIPKTWVERDILHPIKNWKDVWFECKKIEDYCYAETATGRFILSRDTEYAALIHEMQTQITQQTNAKINPRTGNLQRGGPAMVTETVRLWMEWSKKTSLRIGE